MATKKLAVGYAPWTCKLCRCRKNNRRHSTRVAADKAKMLEMLATAAPVPAPPLTTAAPVPAPPTPPPRTPGEIPRATADRMQWWMSPEVEKKSVASARPDHKLELAGGTGRVPGGAQPVGMEAAMRSPARKAYPNWSEFLVAPLEKPAVCVEWVKIDPKQHGTQCGYAGKEIRYTWVYPKGSQLAPPERTQRTWDGKQGWKQTEPALPAKDGRQEIRGCRPEHFKWSEPAQNIDVVNRCSKVRNEEIAADATQTLVFPGPTALLARTAHYPHWMEEVAHIHNMLSIEDPLPAHLNYETGSSLRRASASGGIKQTLLLTEGRGTSNCDLRPVYIPNFNWSPRGNPLNATLQFTALRSVGGGIVTPWGVNPGRRVCFKDVHFPPRHRRKFHFFSGPKVCGEFRDRMVALLGHTEGRTTLEFAHDEAATATTTRRPLNMLVTTRATRGIANLNEMIEHPKIRGHAGIKVTVVSLGEGNYSTSAAQMSLFFEADIYVAAHGASFAHTALMRAGGLVVELFPFDGPGCSYFQGLAESCGLQTAQVYPGNVLGGKTARPAATVGGSAADSSEKARKTARSRLVRRLAELARLEALPRDQLTDVEQRQIAPNKRGEITKRLRETWFEDNKVQQLQRDGSPDWAREGMSRALAEYERLAAAPFDKLTPTQKKKLSPERRQTVLVRLQELWAANSDTIPGHCWGSKHGTEDEVRLDADLVVSKILKYIDARDGL